MSVPLLNEKQLVARSTAEAAGKRCDPYRDTETDRVPQKEQKNSRRGLPVSGRQRWRDEYKEFRAKDAETIERLGVKIRNLEVAARHEVEVKAPIDAAIRDTLIIRDTVPLLRQKVEMVTPYIQLTGLIENKRLKGDIKVPVTLNQAVWVEYKGWWFWKRVKAIHQSISSDNPYVEIRYSEYIRIQ